VLYLIATPIGNLEDITLRALSALKACAYILCEDTRHSHRLLDHYEIKKPLKSYHSFNEKGREEECLADLKNGLDIALISDAGTPGISDPGMLLVRACQREGIAYTAIPGPCAIPVALTLSGFESAPFQFVGFLPKTESELVHTLENALAYKGTTLCYETPHHILKTLEQLALLAPQQKLCIARELTKAFEECLFGVATELLAHFALHPPRGEMVLLFSCSEEKGEFADALVQEDVRLLQERFTLSLSDAIKAVAKFRSLPKSALYRLVHAKEEL
jgi:16S rRNA (cytidine1402-2'-O)-methyltransferase